MKKQLDHDAAESYLPLSENERALLSHVLMWGSDGYPVAKLGRKWQVADAFGVKGPPTIFKTKRAAVAQFEAWINQAVERAGAEAQARAKDEPATRG